MYDGIIDLNHNDDIDFAKVKAKGEIAAIIHKVSEGSTFVDQHFDERRKAARTLGFLWGAYHFGTNADVGAQLKNFLAHAQIEATDFVALDYEKRTLKDGSDITMSLDQAEEFVTRLHEKLGRFPAIYGSDLLAHAAQVRPQSVLGRCQAVSPTLSPICKRPGRSRADVTAFPNHGENPTPSAVSQTPSPPRRGAGRRRELRRWRGRRRGSIAAAPARGRR